MVLEKYFIVLFISLKKPTDDNLRIKSFKLLIITAEKKGLIFFNNLISLLSPVCNIVPKALVPVNDLFVMLSGT